MTSPRTPTTARTRDVTGDAPATTSWQKSRVYNTGQGDDSRSRTSSRPVPVRSGQTRGQRTRPVASDVVDARPRGDVWNQGEERRVSARVRDPQTTNRFSQRDQHRITTSRQSPATRRSGIPGNWHQRIRRGIGVFLAVAFLGCVIYTLVVRQQYDVLTRDYQLPSARLTAVVGHNGDSPEQPTLLYVSNYNGVMVLTEIPSGDDNKIRQYSSPNYFVNDGADTLSVSLRIEDFNHDKEPDVVIFVNGKRAFTFINTGQAFTPSNSSSSR